MNQPNINLVHKMVQDAKSRLLVISSLCTIVVLSLVYISNMSSGLFTDAQIRRLFLFSSLVLAIILQKCGLVLISRILLCFPALVYPIHMLLADEDLMAAPTVITWGMFLLQCLFMFEKRMQRLIFVICFAITGSVYFTYLYRMERENRVLRYEQVRLKAISALLMNSLTLALNFYYTNISNQVFDDVKSYSDRIDQEAKEKETFFACMSHEIRNPIQSLMGSLELLFPVLAKQSGNRDLVEISKGACEVVLNLVSNILDISKIRAGKMELCVAACDPRETILKVLRLARPKAEGKGIELRYVDCKELPAALELDARKLSQVILNIVSNAIKFTQKGGVTVQVSWKLQGRPRGNSNEEEDYSSPMEEEDHRQSRMPDRYTGELCPSLLGPSSGKAKKAPEPRDNLANLSSMTLQKELLVAKSASPRHASLVPLVGNMKLDVIDTGIGIRPECIPRLFKAFNQADASISKHYGGTGLGLWISKSIIELMGGKISVSSSLGVGSTFSIEFPANVCSEQKMLAEESDMVGAFASVQGKKCLLLDDIIENTVIIKHVLERHGVNSLTCNKGEDALEVFKRDQDINAIITDLRMPGMSGQTFIMEVRKIEAEEFRKSIPIIVVTAESDPEERLLCLGKYGATDFLLKPIKLGDLLQSLYKALIKCTEKAKKNILVVEDDHMVSYFVSKIIAQKGHNVVHSASIRDAIKELMKPVPRIDLILLDSMLPDGTGADLLRFMFSSSVPVHVKEAVVISMSGNPSDEQRGKEGSIQGSLQPGRDMCEAKILKRGKPHTCRSRYRSRRY